MVASSNLEEGTPNPTRAQGKSIFCLVQKMSTKGRLGIFLILLRF